MVLLPLPVASCSVPSVNPPSKLAVIHTRFSFLSAKDTSPRELLRWVQPWVLVCGEPGLRRLPPVLTTPVSSGYSEDVAWDKRALGILGLSGMPGQACCV